MKKRNLIGIIFSVLFAATLISTARAQPTTLSAPLVLDPTLGPGMPFSIDITVANIEDLWGFQLVLSFDQSILTATGFSFYAPFVIPQPSVIGPNYVAVAANMPFGIPTGGGFYGTTAIAKIDFIVNAWGGSYLDLSDSLLVNPGGAAIPHELIDGSFSNEEPLWSANLVRRSAWPEHHHWVESKDSDLTLFGRVKNLGTMPTKVKVVFTIKDGDGLWQTTLETDTVTLKSGAMMDLTKDITKSNLNLLPPGPYETYFVQAQCEYDSDGDGIIDAPGTKLKNTKFTLVP